MGEREKHFLLPSTEKERKGSGEDGRQTSYQNSELGEVAMPVPSTQEAEARRSSVQGQPG
jgi:hypothetical protein